MADLTEPMARALEQLAKGPAVRGSRTGMRKVQFNVATRLVLDGLADLDDARRALTITDLGRDALDRDRAGWR